MKSTAHQCFWIKTVFIEITDVNNKWVVDLYLEQGSKYYTTDLIYEGGLNSR